MPRPDVRLDAERRRRLEELVEERGLPMSEVVGRLIDDAYEGILRERRKQAVEHLTKLEVEDPTRRRHAPRVSWRRPMSPPAFTDANVPIYAAGREHENKEPCVRVLMMAAEHSLSFVTDVEVLQELLHRYVATGTMGLGA